MWQRCSINKMASPQHLAAIFLIFLLIFLWHKQQFCWCWCFLWLFAWTNCEIVLAIKYLNCFPGFSQCVQVCVCVCARFKCGQFSVICVRFLCFLILKMFLNYSQRLLETIFQVFPNRKWANVSVCVCVCVWRGVRVCSPHLTQWPAHLTPLCMCVLCVFEFVICGCIIEILNI